MNNPHLTSRERFRHFCESGKLSEWLKVMRARFSDTSLAGRLAKIIGDEEKEVTNAK